MTFLHWPFNPEACECDAAQECKGDSYIIDKYDVYLYICVDGGSGDKFGNEITP